MIVLELYAIEIQMYSDLKETRKLKVSCFVCSTDAELTCRKSTVPR
jgi:hypothetical protein